MIKLVPRSGHEGNDVIPVGRRLLEDVELLNEQTPLNEVNINLFDEVGQLRGHIQLNSEADQDVAGLKIHHLLGEVSKLRLSQQSENVCVLGKCIHKEAFTDFHLRTKGECIIHSYH